MPFLTWIALAVAALMPPTASAQQSHTAPASREAPAPGYLSAFTGYKSFTDDDDTPDTRWRAVNDEVGQLGGHAAHIKGDGGPASFSPANGMRSGAGGKGDAPVDHSRHH